MISAKILPGTERAAAWLRVFGGDTVPLKSSIPQEAYLPGVGFAPVLLVDVDALSEEQLERVVAHCSLRFGEPLDKVREGLAGGHGLPIVADDLVVIEQLAEELVHARGLPLPGAPPTLCGQPGPVPSPCGLITCERCIAITGSVELLQQAIRDAQAPTAGATP